jgi:hypothetical protein
MTSTEEASPNTLPTPSTLRDASRGATKERVDMYGAVHRALRYSLANLLVSMGRTSFADANSTSAIVSELEAVLWATDDHIAREDGWIRPALAERVPSAVAVLDDEHDQHTVQAAELRALAKSLKSAATEGARAALGNALYMQFSVFVSDTLAHMAYEERVIQPLLDRAFTRAELQAVQGSLLASIAPPDMFKWLRSMIPSGNAEQRKELLERARAKAPPEVFRALLDAIRPHPSADEWVSLSSST